MRTSGGSTSIAVTFEPNGYLPKNCSAVSCTFCKSVRRCFVVFVGLLLGGSKGTFSGEITCTSGASLSGGQCGAFLGRGGRGIGVGGGKSSWRGIGCGIASSSGSGSGGGGGGGESGKIGWGVWGMGFMENM